MHSALDTAERDHFDLIISDVGLPDGNGTELMKRLRFASRIRGIAISGFGSNADREKSLAAGFSEHLVKPITMERLEAAIQTVLRVREKTGVGAPRQRVNCMAKL